MPRIPSEQKPDLVSRVKAHPVIAVVVLIFVVMTGTATFVREIRSLKDAVVCIPFDLGLSAYEGRASIVTNTPKFDWYKARVESRVMGTANHHCARDCRGEPTRTNYSIDLDISPLLDGTIQQLRDPELTCVTGPCDEWKEIISPARITEGGLRATASFDVWSRPTTWMLSADVYEYRVSDLTTDTIRLEVSTKDTLELIAPTSESSIRVKGVMEDDTPFEFQVGQNDETKIFTELTRAASSEGERIVFEVGNPRCETS